MDILRKAIEVKLTRLPTTVDEEPTTLLLSWQPIRFQLTISFFNKEGERGRDGAALLAALGENDFDLMWRKLFHTIRIVPVVVEATASPDSGEIKGPQSRQPSPSSEQKNAAQHGEICYFSFEAPAFWGSRSAVETASDCELPGVTGPSGRILTLVAESREDDVAAGTASSKAGDLEIGMRGAIPGCITSTYKFNYTLPDLGEFHGSITMGYVLLFTFCGTDSHDSENAVMLNALVPAEERSISWYRPKPVVLGTCYYRANVGQVLRCTSVARRAAHLRVLVNVNVTNVAEVPVLVQQASFDIFSTWIGENLGSLSSVPLWSEQRAGPRGADMRAVELLRRAVTVTPIVVHEFHVPLTLESGESAGFQFVIQVQPYLCHLLESHSLQELYGKFVKSPHREAAEMETRDALKCAGTAATNPSSPLASFINGISRDDLLQVLSWSFTSHVYVYYEVITPTGSNVKDNDKNKRGA
ncbi:Protein X92, partial [Trypanosoma grayi]|uniref:Protein X92 n=1 Tax=Trypanosoma grayi TaxID=71804 RepID=UPI0004F4498A